MMSLPTRLSAIILPLCGVLAGCTGSSNGVDDLLTTSSVGKLNLEAPAPHISNYSIARRVRASDALVQPSVGFGDVVEVSETRFVNGISQRIGLEGQPGQFGENWVSIQISDGRKQANRPNILAVRKPTARSVSARLKRHFPKRAMAINSATHTNSYGVFGTAHARGTNSSGCHYAWQYLQPHKARTAISWPSLRTAPKAVLLETRICRAGMSAGHFAALMREIELDIPADVLTAKRGTMWSSGTPLAGSTASDLVGPDVPIVTQGPINEPVQTSQLSKLPAPTRQKAPKLSPKVTSRAQPVTKAPALATAPKPVAVASVPLPDSEAPIVRPSNRIDAAAVAKFPTVPLPE
ncbi:MAG: cellulose biosynthesis protein BcsN [Pseudomonadota bacterium]